MKKLHTLVWGLFIVALSSYGFSQCEITAKAIPDTNSDAYPSIYCGQSIQLEAEGYGDGTVLLHEDFNSGAFGSGWSSTPGSVDFSNPCSPGGVDGTPHAWMGSNTSVPRIITSQSYDLTTATAGVTICFDLLFATQGNAAPCEGPDEPDEGVYLQYSIDGGTNWITIHYFDPNGGNDPQLTNWNNWCFQIPAAALTSNTMFRWFQDNDSGADYDHWGIDNVDIVVNDVNAEIVWGNPGDPYYYSYGVGSAGGLHPTTFTPTSTSTYVVTITTGTGATCTDSVTVNVIPPIFSADINTVPDPATVCNGDCIQTTGNTYQVIDSGGITTYANNEVSPVATGSATVDINVQGLNMANVNPGSIQEICINHFQFSGTQLCTNFGGCNCNGSTINFGETCDLNASGFTITLTSPSGCSITLVPSGVISSDTIDGMCFVPVGGDPISSGTGTYNGTFDPQDPISGFDGCQANGVWTLSFNSGSPISVGVGFLTGWSITFDNPPITYPATTIWNPTNGVADVNSINTNICPPNIGTNNYTLTVSNGVSGCPTQDFPLAIEVNNCNCTQPTLTVTPINTCTSPVDISSVVGNPNNANLTYYSTQSDAQNATNPISSSVSTSGSYWVRGEDPSDPTCFTIMEIVVTITAQDASFTFNDFCPGSTNGPTNIATAGGTFSFNPNPTDGATIDATTGIITGATNGTNYTIEYTVGTGACQQTHTENVSATGITYTAAITNANCGQSDGSIVLTVNGGSSPYSYSVDNGTTTQPTNSFNNLSVGNYSILITDNTGCQITGTESVSNIGGPIITDSTLINPSCNNLCDGLLSVTVSGGTPPYNYTWEDESGNSVGTDTNTINNLCGGNYTLTISDNAGGGSGANTIYSEDFESGAVDWTLNDVLATEGADPNFFKISDQEGGVAPGGCGVAGNGDKTLFITSVFNPNGGAAYDAGGLCPTLYCPETHRQAESPIISTIGQTNLTLNFDYIANGAAPNDEATVWYNDGTGWTQLGTALNSGTCPLGQGLWTAYSQALPASCENISNLQIALRWDNNDDGVGTDPSVAINNLNIVANSGSGASPCSTSASYSIPEPAALDASFTGLDSTYCNSNSLVTLTSTQNGTFSGTGINGNTFDPSVTGNGTYTITHIVSNGVNCADTVTQTVVVSGPNASFTADPTTTDLSNTQVVFTNGSTSASNYVWNFDDSTALVFDKDAIHTFPNDKIGSYTVTLIATDLNGCSDTAQTIINIGNPGMDFKLPNVFTPNGDNNNDFFKFVTYHNIGKIDVVILNRWGNLVFKSDKVNFKWNGKKLNNGNDCTDGVYFYEIKMKDLDGKPLKTSGYVHLSRGNK